MHTRMNRVRGYKTTTGRFKFVCLYNIYIEIQKLWKKYERFGHGIYAVGAKETFRAVPILYIYIVLYI